MRILLADDHGILRAGLRALLSTEPEFEVVGEAAGGEEALEQAEELEPDIILLDISMPGLDGLEVARRLQEVQPQARVLILTLHEEDSLLQESLRAGASGYIVKRAVKTELIDAIRAVHQGHIYVHPTMTAALLPDRPASRSNGDEPVEALTPREQEVLLKIAEGYTNRQIAEEWTISVRTVESHRASLMHKLDLHSRVELVRYAVDHGLLALAREA